MPLPSNRPRRSMPRDRHNVPAPEPVQPPVQNNDNMNALPPRKPARGQHEPEAPVYDVSNGYPKGLPEGPTVVRTVKGVRKLIHGAPWEQLPESVRDDLDRNPLDDSGQLRVYVQDSFYGVGNYIELGSDEHARKFQNALRERGRKLL